MRNMNPIAKAVLSAAIFGLIVLSVQYIRQVFVEQSTVFVPDWPIVGVAAGLFLAMEALRLWKMR